MRVVALGDQIAGAEIEKKSAEQCKRQAEIIGRQREKKGRDDADHRRHGVQQEPG